MNVRLAAQTLSSSVADAIEFLDMSMKMSEFQGSQSTVTFIRTLDKLFDMLNSRSPIGKGYKQPLRPNSKDIWENSLKAAAEYLLSLHIKGKHLSLALLPPLSPLLRWLMKCFMAWKVHSNTC